MRTLLGGLVGLGVGMGHPNDGPRHRIVDALPDGRSL